MELIALPAFNDNLIWMLHDGRQALVVDPGESAPVRDALDRQGLQLACILVTHHHGDHVGGVTDLLPRLQGPLLAPATERMPPAVDAAAQRVRGGQRLAIAGLAIAVMDVPGHTAGHVAYVCRDAAEPGTAPWLFCGDTLFSGGCGRLFEGTPAQMHDSLQALGALPAATRVCCAHEYTLSNLRFAAAVEPGNAALATYTTRCQDLRARGAWTLPSTIATELAVNPFLRVGEPAVIAAAQRAGAASDRPVDVLAALREWKNHF